MRILYVNHTGRMSGGEHSLVGLLAALPAGVEATVACPEGQLTRYLRKQGIETRGIQGTDGSLRLHAAATPRALLEMGRAALQIRRLAAAAGAELIHANSIRAGIVATQASRWQGPPTVVHVRDCLPPGRLSAFALRAIGRAEGMIANSEYTRSTLGAAGDAAVVIHNAVDLEHYGSVRLSRSEARVRLGLGRCGPALGVIAQMTPWKGQDDAIEIAAGLRSRFPGLQLLLVGSPKFTSRSTRYDNISYFEDLRRRVAARGLTDTVRFLGERDDVPELLRALDLLLVPSWEEPFGRTIVEAMASGVAVAATEVGGPREILGEDRCGLLLPPREPHRWVQALEHLLADEGSLTAMGERGRLAAQRRFGVDRHVERVLSVYETLAERSADVAAVGV